MSRNIVFLNTHFSWGGGENWTLMTARGLRARDHQVWIAGRRKSKLLERAARQSFKLRYVNLYNGLSALNPVKIASFTGFLRDNNIEVIFLNLSRDRKFGVICGNLAGLDKIIYRRGVDRPLKRRFYASWLYGRGLTDIVVNSKATRESVLENLADIIPEDKIKLIYNGIEIADRIEPDFSLRKKYDLGEEEHILINVGRLASEKGHDLLLEAVKELNREMKNWKLLIVGEGPERDNIIRQVKKYELDDRVILTGFVDNVNDYLVQADLMVHSARIEGFGLVLAEAMAAGLPVVAAAASNIPEIIRDGEVGLLAEKENPEELAEKIKFLLENNSLRAEYGSKGREFVKENFSISRMISEYEELINK